MAALRDRAEDKWRPSGAFSEQHNKDPTSAVHTVVEGLGGGNEIVGGLWVLLISCAALRVGALGKALDVIGVVVSAAGLRTVIPALGEIDGMVFGLGTIAWFAWLGIVMLRGSKRADE
jgi:hypothetical protein